MDDGLADGDPEPRGVREAEPVAVTERRRGETPRDGQQDGQEQRVAGLSPEEERRGARRAARAVHARPCGGSIPTSRSNVRTARRAAPRRNWATCPPGYQWMRGSEAIPGAHGATYVVRRGDVGHYLHVEVMMLAQNWVPATRHSVGTAKVRAGQVVEGIRAAAKAGADAYAGTTGASSSRKPKSVRRSSKSRRRARKK